MPRVLVLALFLLALPAPLLAGWKAGDHAYIGVRTAGLHSRPSALSRRVATLPRYAPVQIVQVSKGAKSDDAGTSASRRGWLIVSSGTNKGYVPEGVLIDADQRKQESQRREASDDDSSAAGRGFSEDESDADLKSMKGGMGDATLGASASPQLDQWLAKERTVNADRSADQTFRMDGRLGEFKPRTAAAPASPSTPDAGASTAATAKQE